TNRETLHPRGRVLCEAAGADALLDQLAAVFATGNRAVVRAPGDALLPKDLPAVGRAAIDRVAAKALPDIDLALCSLPEAATRLRQQLAAGDGHRVRVVTPIDGAYPLAWLVVERVVSVNTAAAGGNASLMTLEAD